MSKSMVQKVVIWFRNDLRVHDQNLLTASLQAMSNNLGSNQKKLLCVYCLDTRFVTQASPVSGSKRRAVFSANFLLQSISNLRSNLRNIGADLLVTKETPEDFFPRVLTDGGMLLVSHEHAYEEQKIVRNVTKRLKASHNSNKLHKQDNASSILVKEIDGIHTLYHPEDIPYTADCRQLPNTFTVFRDKVEKLSSIRSQLPTVDLHSVHKVTTDDLTTVMSDTCSFDYLPSLSELGYSNEEVAALQKAKEQGVLSFDGGEDAALLRLQTWAFDENKLQEYFDIRNGMLGGSYSSKLSPWLALGCISPRRIYWEVKRYEAERIANKSTYWLIFELLWRDFFWYLCKKYDRQIFYSTGAAGKAISWRNVQDWIARWKSGTTGNPLVDANMRELRTTGWMSNRGRQNVASYLVLELGVDWRVGADHFESLLLDHDAYSNYGNWNAAAGLTGGRVNQFNIVKQSRDYDPRGDYIRYWLPELAKVPAPLIFEPWKLSKAEQQRYGVTLGVDYPLPIDAKRPPVDADAFVQLGKKSMFSAENPVTVVGTALASTAQLPASTTITAGSGGNYAGYHPTTADGDNAKPTVKAPRSKSKFSRVQHL